MNNIDLHSLFFHGQHIEDPKWFAGRKLDIERALKSLSSPGSSMVVFGERGVGKSSFLEMVKQIAVGNSHLLFKHSLHKIYPAEKFKFKVVSIVCDADCTSTGKVLQRLITSPEGLKSLISSRIEKVESVIKDRATLDLFKLFTIGTSEEKKIVSSELREETIFELFTNLIISISKNILASGEGLLVVIDEFDLVTDSSKMASLIKNLSKGNVKFLVSGIAESYEKLLAGHQSVFRQLTYGRIEILKMNFNEVAEVFSIVEENTKRKVRFEETFIKEVFEKSNGYPYFVQLFGQLALDNHIETRGITDLFIIHPQYLKGGLKKLGLLESHMEKDYASIIRENPARELLLKFLAKQAPRKISDKEILTYCHKHGITQPEPKYQLANLLAHRDPHFLTREREDSDFVYFINPLFKTFINSRDPLYLKYIKGDLVINK
jgi:hypothetical protein